LPDFSWYNMPKRWKLLLITIKYTKWQQNIPNDLTLDQTAIQYTNIFQCRTLQNLPKLGFSVIFCRQIKAIIDEIWDLKIASGPNPWFESLHRRSLIVSRAADSKSPLRVKRIFQRTIWTHALSVFSRRGAVVPERKLPNTKMSKNCFKKSKKYLKMSKNHWKCRKNWKCRKILENVDKY
jgi:hypothetical protein